VYDKVFYSITAREIILEWDKTACRFVFFLLDLDLDLDLPFLKRTWTRTWTCPFKVDLDLDMDLRIGDLDLDLDLAVAGLVTSLALVQVQSPIMYRSYGLANFSHNTCVTDRRRQRYKGHIAPKA